MSPWRLVAAMSAVCLCTPTYAVRVEDEEARTSATVLRSNITKLGSGCHPYRVNLCTDVDDKRLSGKRCFNFYQCLGRMGPFHCTDTKNDGKKAHACEVDRDIPASESCKCWWRSH
mmetsp:Transcript_53493/g.124520  ORF Transcript_53493/g.124520 Transcript_53493/m.124520 type:complete len:116 (+) Transcript_53493:89-436(+)